MRFTDSEDRERYMDSLERHMEGQRGQIQRTLARIESSGRRGTILERLWNSLPSFPGRTPAQDAGEGREAVSESPENAEPTRRAPPGSSTGAQQPSERPQERPWLRRMFGR